MKKGAYTYILASSKSGTFYTGVTNNLSRRVREHRMIVSEFNDTGTVDNLVWYEWHNHVELAQLRERRLKRIDKKRQVALIEQINPGWRDLSHDVAAV